MDKRWYSDNLNWKDMLLNKSFNLSEAKTFLFWFFSISIIEENIKSGINILGVEGTFTSDGTQSTGYNVATSNEIIEGYSAWVDGEEVLGNVKINNFYYGTTEPDTNLGNDGDIYLRN